MQKTLVSLLLVCLFSVSTICAQEGVLADSIPQENTQNTVERPLNAVTAGLGFSVANGDYPNALFELNLHLGYKRFLSPSFNVGLTYHKFNIAFEDVYNEGFMSFDLNLEYLLFPEKELTPFTFTGIGLNAANRFEQTDFKFQVGAGLEYLVNHAFGLKLQADWNFISSDLLDGLEAGGSYDTYYRISLGTNIYFPLDGTKRKKGEPSFIDANQIEY